VTFPAPGGCVIGERPIDLFLSGYAKMGAGFLTTGSTYVIAAPDRLCGSEIFFGTQAVGPTETLMQAAVLANGTTVLKNCALEPEIESIATWLNECGASIRGAGTPTITVKGTGGRLLSAKKSAYVCIPDRIEAASFLILGALCASSLVIRACEPTHMEAIINLLIEAGADILVRKNSLLIRGSDSAPPFRAVRVKTHEYPGLATDIQAPLVTLLTQATGDSPVFETIFENRFKYTADLISLGAAIKTLNPREILVHGPTPFTSLSGGRALRAHDIRAGFAVVLAALVATGTSTVENVHLIDRGYADLEGRLRALGADVRRVTA
jgi:UDP-N-acetylglucosamine 1-carboxyvinyltransferase